MLVKHTLKNFFLCSCRPREEYLLMNKNTSKIEMATVKDQKTNQIFSQ